MLDVCPANLSVLILFEHYDKSKCYQELWEIAEMKNIACEDVWSDRLSDIAWKLCNAPK